MRRLDRRAFLRLTGSARPPASPDARPSAIVAAPFSDGRSSWRQDAPPSTEAAMLAWLRGYHDAVRSAIRPGAYANYADPDPVDWPEVYYGANYARPQRVKARYDPDNVFTFSAVRPRLGTHRPTGFL